MRSPDMSATTAQRPRISSPTSPKPRTFPSSPPPIRHTQADGRTQQTPPRGSPPATTSFFSPLTASLNSSTISSPKTADTNPKSAFSPRHHPLPPSAAPQSNALTDYFVTATPLKKVEQRTTASPNYFGLEHEHGGNPLNSSAGGHARKNWATSIASNYPLPPSVAPQDTNASGLGISTIPHENNPEYEDFRQNSAKRDATFRLPQPGMLRSATASSDGLTLQSLKDRMPSRSNSLAGLRGKKPSLEFGKPLGSSLGDMSGPNTAPLATGFNLERTESPLSIARQESAGMSPQPAAKLPRLSISRASAPSFPSLGGASAMGLLSPPNSSSGSSPGISVPEGLKFIAVPELKKLLSQTPEDEVLILDLRVSAQYGVSRFANALNLCLPSTLLKRPAYTVRKLAETFGGDNARTDKFSTWESCRYIITYDSSSTLMKDASSSVNMIKKFLGEGWDGTPYIVRGGFAELCKRMPEKIETGSTVTDGEIDGLSKGSIPNRLASIMPVAGGCHIPENQKASNPFFGTIRQNMDLIGGVGQMDIKQPAGMTDANSDKMPAWLKSVAATSDHGKAASDRFLKIEEDEKERLQKALSGDVVYGTPNPALTPSISSSSKVQMAGLEKGVKNRYKDMLPYDHSRVKLQNVEEGCCDYINASYVQAGWSNRRYICSQAPPPATFDDFWRVVWEQDVRVIVMLTAESENGLAKSHPYWVPNTYGPLRVKSINEKKISLNKTPQPAKRIFQGNSEPGTPAMAQEKESMRRRGATTSHGGQDMADPFAAAAGEATGNDGDRDRSFVIVRKLTLSHSSYPFQPMREITQLHYTEWPDLGTPACAADLLSLVEQTSVIVRASNGGNTSGSSSGLAGLKSSMIEPARSNERPVLVHCSAGCGRTGTFCTIDSVLDMMKRQKLERSRASGRLGSVRRRSEYDADEDEDRDDTSGSGMTQKPMQHRTRYSSSESSTSEADSETGSKMTTDTEHDTDSDVEMHEPNSQPQAQTQAGHGHVHPVDPFVNPSSKPGFSPTATRHPFAKPALHSSLSGAHRKDLPDWVFSDDNDLVALTVADLRTQRISLVQNLRQFVLCYEAVLEWVFRN